MTPDSSPEQLEQLHYWAVTFDGQAPGAGGQFNAAGWPTVDRDFAIAQALDIAMRRGIDTSAMRVFHRVEVTVKSDWVPDDSPINNHELIDELIDEIREIDGYTFPDKL
jgi:hypothetical protein